MTTLINKIIRAFDGIEVFERLVCEGAGIAEYVYVNAQVIISFEMNGKEGSIVYQNGHSYRGNDYSCPSNLFEVYEPEWVRKVDNLSVGFVHEDEDDLNEIIEASGGFLKSVDDIKQMVVFIAGNTPPSLSSIGESSDVDDYEITEHEDGHPVVVGLKSEDDKKILVTAKLLADVVEQGFIEVRSGVCLNHRDSIMEEQKDWCDEDESKHFDFSTSDFWLTTNCGATIQAIQEGDEI